MRICGRRRGVNSHRRRRPVASSVGLLQRVLYHPIRVILIGGLPFILIVRRALHPVPVLVYRRVPNIHFLPLLLHSALLLVPHVLQLLGAVIQARQPTQRYDDRVAVGQYDTNRLIQAQLGQSVNQAQDTGPQNLEGKACSR